MEAIKCGFHKGSLSTSMCQCIITCLPKPNKARSFIKNWQPISFVSVVYTLASGVIADKIKALFEPSYFKMPNRFY